MINQLASSEVRRTASKLFPKKGREYFLKSLTKCAFMVKYVMFLGHKLSEHDVYLDIYIMILMTIYNLTSKLSAIQMTKEISFLSL